MKKTILRLFSLCLVLTLALTCLPAPAKADTLQEGNFYYEVYEGMAGIVGCEPGSVGQTLVIPDTLGGYPVRAIGPYCFQNCSQITSLTLPETLYAIDNRAFSGCTGLTELELPASLMYLGDCAFLECFNLTRVTAHGFLALVNDAFLFCDKLEYNTYQNGLYLGDEAHPYRNLMKLAEDDISEFSLHPQVQAIGANVFMNCEELTQITLPQTLRAIGSYAFCGTGLTRADIPDSVLAIGECAFNNCEAMTEVTIGKGLILLLPRAFDFTNQLAGFTVAPENAYFCHDEYGALLSKDQTILFKVPGGLSGSYTAPEALTQIDAAAFGGCLSLTEILLPEGLQIIGDQAFRACSSLTQLSLPHSLTAIGSEAYRGCYALTDIWYYGTQAQYKTILCEEAERYPLGVSVHYLVIAIPYDFNEDDKITDADAIYLLRYTLFPDSYPLSSSGDANNDGNVTDADAIYLLRHTLFPDSYPLN